MANNSIPKKINASLYIDGKPAQSSIKNVEQDTRKLRKELNGLTIGTDEWNKKLKQVQQHQKYLKNVREEVRGVGGAFANMSAKIGKVGGLLGIGVGLSGMTAAFQKVISANAELSDAMAGVVKTTGLGQAAIERLNKSLMSIDTRTAKSELLGLAEVAGRLGITAEEDILGFVRAADKIGVALGTELGGTEDAVRSLGKLADIFKQTELYGIEDSLLKIGSAINELGMAGTANEGYMVDFAQRLAGVAPAANISITDVLGLATTLDELGQSAESSSTAIGQFIVGMGAEVPKFAKLLNMPVEEFSSLLRNDAMEAFRQVLTASSSVNGGIEALAANMGDLGVKGNRGIAAIGSLAENVQTLRDRQDLASKSFIEGTSILEEFGNVNNTLAGNLAKIRNNLSNLWENGWLRNALTDLTAVITGTYSASGKMTTALLEQKAAFNDLKKEADPAIAQYDTLFTKVDKNKVEHEKLASAIKTLSGLYPSAITEVDKYGNAIEINTEKVRQLMEAERLLLQQQNKRAIEASKEEEMYLERELNRLKNVARTGRETVSMGYQGGFSVTERELSNSDLKQINEQISEMEERLRVKQLQLQKLGADVTFTATREEMQRMRSAEGEFDALKERYNEIIEIQKEGTELSKEQLSIVERYQKATGTWIEPATKTGGGEKDTTKKPSKAITEAKKLQEDLDKINQEIFEKQLSNNDREVEAMRVKYEKLRKQAKGNADQLRQIDEMEGKEALLLSEKIADETEKLAAEKNRARLDAEAVIAKSTRTDRQIELAETEAHYRRLLELAQQFGMEKASIIDSWANATLNINKKYDEIEADAAQRNASKWKISDREYEEEKRDFQLEMAGQAADATFNIMRNSNQAKLDNALNKLNEQREAELSNVNLTEEQRQAINEKFDAQIREEKRKAFIADQRAAIAQAVVNGALAATKVLSQTGILSPFVLPAIAASTALQIATIASQPVPEFAVGGFSDQDPEGYVGQPTLFKRSASGRPFIAGEKGSEWIAPNWMLRDPNYANIIGMLETARQEKRFFANGGSTGSATIPSTDDNGTIQEIRELKVLMGQYMSEIQRVQSQPVVFSYKEYTEYKRNLEFQLNKQGKR